MIMTARGMAFARRAARSAGLDLGGQLPAAATANAGSAGDIVLAPGGQVSFSASTRGKELRSAFFLLVPPDDELICAAANLCRMLRHGQPKYLSLAEILREERYRCPIFRWVDGGPSPGIER